MSVAVNQLPLFERDRTGKLIGRYLSNTLFAPRCLLCDEASQSGYDLCSACAAALPWLGAACRRCAQPLAHREGPQALCGACQQTRSPLQRAHSVFVYADPVSALLRRFKFHQDLTAGRLLAQLMAPVMVRFMQSLCPEDRPQAIVPVPLHVARLRQRGYDQALELAKPLARFLNVPLLHGLHRIRATQAQSQLDAKARKRNMRCAFAARAVRLPAHVLLIDDVMTTGATLYAAAYALSQARVQRIDAWVCARAP